MIYATSLRIWVNRVLLTPFLISLIVGLFDSDYFFYSLILAFILGVFQLLSFLVTIADFSNHEEQFKKCIKFYFLLVFVYFLGCYIKWNNSITDKLGIIMFVIRVLPVALALFWTYIIESIKKEQ